MNRFNPVSSCAVAAIAAAMAFGPTSAIAQTAETAPPAPDISAPAPSVSDPAPTAAVPAPTAPVAAPAPAPSPSMTSNPVVQQVPATPTPAASPVEEAANSAPTAAAAPTPRRAQAATQRATPRADAVPAAAAAPVLRSVTPVGGPGTPAPTLADTTQPSVAPDPVVSPVDQGSQRDTTALLAVLAALGLGGAGLMMLRRRRVPAETVYAEETVEPVTEAAPMATSAWSPPSMTRVRAQDGGMLDPPNAAPWTEEEVAVTEPRPVTIPAPAYSAAAAADPEYENEFDDPRMVDAVPTGQARQALVAEMVAAEPDEANPFRSPAARRRRARLILQKREHDQAEAANAFDWRSYSSTRAAGSTEPARERETSDA